MKMKYNTTGREESVTWNREEAPCEPPPPVHTRVRVSEAQKKSSLEPRNVAAAAAAAEEEEEEEEEEESDTAASTTTNTFTAAAADI